MLRFLKIVGILFLLLTVLWVGAYYYLRIKYPPERIKYLAEKILSEQLQQRVTLDKAGIHLTSGILLRGLTVYQKAPCDTSVFVQVAEVQLRYRLLSILRRHLEIRQVRIIGPHLYWHSELASTTTAPISQSEPVPASLTSSKTELPIHISLREFLLQDLKVNFTIIDSTAHLQGTIGGLNAKLSDLFFPRGSGELWQRLNFKLQVDTDDAEIAVFYQPQVPLQLGTWPLKAVALNTRWQLHFSSQTQPSARSQAIPQLASVGVVAFPGKMNFHGRAQLQQPQMKLYGTSEVEPFQNYLPDLEAEWQGQVNLDSLDVIIETLQAHVGDWFDFEGQGMGYHLLQHPRIQCNFAPIVIRLQPLEEWLQALHLPLSLQIPDLKMEGEYQIEEASIQGDLSPSKFQIELTYRSVLSDFGLVPALLPLELADARWELEVSGMLNADGFQRGRIQGKAEIPEFQYALNDTTIIQPKSLHVDYEMSLGTHFVPQHLSLLTKINDVFSGDGFLFTDVTVSGAETPEDIGVENLTGTAELQIRNLDLESLTAGEQKGNFDLHTLVTTNYGYNGFLTFDIHGKNVEYSTEEGYEALPELSLTGKSSLFSTQGFQQIFLKGGSFRLNDLITGKLTVELEELGKKIKVSIDQLQVDHSKIRPLLPSYLRQELETAKWEGKSQVQVQLDGWVDDEGQFQNNLSGRFSIENYSFDDPEAFLSLDSLKIQGELLGTLNEIRVPFEGKLLEFNITDVFPKPVTDTRFQGSAVLSKFDRLQFSRIEIHQPEKNISVYVEGMIDSMTVYPLYDFKIWLDFHAMEYVPLLTDFALSGDFAANCRIYSKSDNIDIFIFDGIIDFRNLNARIGQDVWVDGIHGSTPFFQKIDVENSVLVNPLLRSFPAWYLPLFSQMEPYLPGVDRYYSTVRIDSVRVMQYRITDIQTQMSFANGLINVPKLSMKLYEGNIVAQCLVDLGSGSLEDISYQFRAQIARINSARFPGTATTEAEAAEIAATINFTGQGLDPEKKLEMEGELQITDIGAKTTDNLLYSIDPQGSEENIKYVRLLIGLGFKPKLLSFPIRHGNFYPTFELRQPWYIPIRIAGGKMAIPRIPMQFIIDLISAQSRTF